MSPVGHRKSAVTGGGSKCSLSGYVNHAGNKNEINMA